MKASVIIPSFNKLPLLLRTLEGLGRQDCDPGTFEVIVVDDASTDGTSEAIARLRPPYTLRAIRHERNLGRAVARNSAIKAAEGRLIVFLDDDMDVVEGFLSSHIRAHGGAERLAVVGNVRTHPRADGSAVSRYLDTRGAQKIRTRGYLPFRYFSTNNSSLARADLEAVGLFDEAFSTYGFEDVDMGARLSKELGVRFLFCEEAASLHIHKHSLEDFLEKKIACGRSSLRILLRKHPELWSQVGMAVVEPPRLLREPITLSLKKSAFRILNGTGLNVLAEAIVRNTTFYHLTNALMNYLVVRSYWIGMGRPEAPGSFDFNHLP